MVSPTRSRKGRVARIGVWTCVGVALAFSVLSAFAIFLFPLACVGLYVIVRSWGVDRDTAWLATGAGAVVLAIGLVHLGATQCSDPATLSISPNGPPVSECSSFDPLPWIVAGGILMTVSVVGYAVGGRHRSARGRADQLGS